MGIESVARAGHSSWLDESPHRNPAPTRSSSGHFGRSLLALKATRGPDNWIQLGVRSQAGQRLIGVVEFVIRIIHAFRKYREIVSNPYPPEEMETK